MYNTHKTIVGAEAPKLLFRHALIIQCPVITKFVPYNAIVPFSFEP